jgi:UPF0042 nucleotide-binding protein
MSDETLQVIVLTGLSGSGKTTALHALEDAGFFCVDNLPTPLVGTLLRLCDENPTVKRVGLAIDVRDRPFLGDVERALDELHGPNRDVRILFLDSADASIINRFKTTRRPHPVMAQGAAPHLAEAINLERSWLGPFRSRATDVIDTTPMSVHDLRQWVHDHFGASARQAMAIHLYSFGFRHGLPPESDFVLDARFLDNPYFVAELRDKSGLDPDVAAFVLEQPMAKTFLADATQLLFHALPGIEREKRAMLTIAIGCTGGHHRSVAMAEALGQVLREAGRSCEVRHRDLARGP